MNALRRQMIEILSDLAAGRSVPASRAASLKAKLEPRRRSAPKKVLGNTMDELRAAKRAKRQEETASLWRAVMARAGGLCELCGSVATDMHHLEGGAGRRRERQSVSNCMALCMICHRAYHRDAEQFRAAVSGWCAQHGYVLPARFRRAA